MKLIKVELNKKLYWKTSFSFPKKRAFVYLPSIIPKEKKYSFFKLKVVERIDPVL